MTVSAYRAARNLSEVATRLAGQTALWSPLVEFDPATRYYTRLATEPTYEAWLLTWLPGQGTEWHDHGGSAGAFVVLDGRLVEEHAEVAPHAAPRIHPQARELRAGTLRSFGRRHVHQVINAALEPAVSLHVYAPALTEMNAYQALGDRLRLVSSSRIGVDW